jgi:hypothetical protein
LKDGRPFVLYVAWREPVWRGVFFAEVRVGFLRDSALLGHAANLLNHTSSEEVRPVPGNSGEWHMMCETTFAEPILPNESLVQSSGGGS